MRKQDWWKSAVVYQIYPRSFQDSNGDGIGDIPGMISRLDYLEKLGIDVIWLSPLFRSPQDDNGYDISDYRDIDPMFGTLADMDELIARAGEHHIGIVMDMVLNHSSDEHPWFIEAKKSRDNPYHDYYIWVDGEEGKLPNDLKASFGGPAWEYVPELGQYYFHEFSVKQPDLNWENEKVRREIYDIINFWIDRGVAGFRFDVLELFGKQPLNRIIANGPKLHEYLDEMTAATFGGKNLITVGECWNADLERAKRYASPDGRELSMVFQFEHSFLDQGDRDDKWALAPLDFIGLKKVFAKWQTGLRGEGWNSLFWDNHDMPRIVSRWGNDQEYWKESAKMLAIVLHGMQGTPYVYEGEEIGMTNTDYPIEEYRDIELLHAYREKVEAGMAPEEMMRAIHARGRDNARTPMQWSDEVHAGFTSPEGQPWLKVNPNYCHINAASQVDDPDSIFSTYRKLIALRKEDSLFTEGDFTLLEEEDPDLFIYKRQLGERRLVVIANFHEVERHVPMQEWLTAGEVLVHNYADRQADTLRPYEAYMIRR